MHNTNELQVFVLQDIQLRHAVSYIRMARTKAIQQFHKRFQ